MQIVVQLPICYGFIVQLIAANWSNGVCAYIDKRKLHHFNLLWICYTLCMYVQSSTSLLDDTERVHACTPVSRATSICDDDDRRSQPENDSNNAIHSSVHGMIVHNNNNNNNNNHDYIYSAVIMAEPLREFTRFSRWIQKRRQVAADLWTKPIGWNRRPAYRQPVNRIHHRHLLLLLSPKTDTHFTVPRRVEGWVDLGGCYIRDGLPGHGRSPIQVLTGSGVE